MPRQRFSLNANWLFSGAAPGAAGEESARLVHLPHTVRLTPYSGFDESLYQGRFLYRRRLNLPREWRGRRVRVEFDGAMTALGLSLNGQRLGEHFGGFTPCVFDLTPAARWGGENWLEVELDTTERPDTPPFGGQVDYLCYGGLYRDARLWVHEAVWIERVAPRPRAIARGRPALDVFVVLRNDGDQEFRGEVCLRIPRGGGAFLETAREVALAPQSRLEVELALERAAELELWSLECPVLHEARVELREFAGGKNNVSPVDERGVRFGFREARFEEDGFYLNGRRIALRGLNRHQDFPWMGYAAPARLQRRDAEILRRELHCNIVRSSHYPPSPHFLDRCDELGLLVFEEVPGWQHLGGELWRRRLLEALAAMIERDCHHPSVILWGVRVNESLDDEELYRQTNALARALDPTRQTGGVRCFFESRFLEDVFTMNDFNPERLGEPPHRPYLVTEFCGHTYPVKAGHGVERHTEHIRRHARIQSQAAERPGVAGALGWAAFDYATHADFGSGDRICYHGVCDRFRLPKPAAALYRSQAPPEEEIVLEPGFAWSLGDRAGGGGVGRAWILSNCEYLHVLLDGRLMAELRPRHEDFPGLPHPPFALDERFDFLEGHRIREMTLIGFLGGREAARRILSPRGVDADFLVRADDSELIADGSDATRVWFMVTDEHGARRPLAVAAIRFEIEGLADLIGENPFPLIAGAGAVWVRPHRLATPANILIRAIHPRLGERRVELRATPPDEENPL